MLTTRARKSSTAVATCDLLIKLARLESAFEVNLNITFRDVNMLKLQEYCLLIQQVTVWLLS
jgi:hypothetical protein